MVQAKVFGFDKGFEALGTALAAQPRGFHATERDRMAGELDAIDRDHGVVEAANQGVD